MSAVSEDTPVSRPAARVACLDSDNRVLLLHWRDPVDGSLVWEPPGGGIEAGETPYVAACRELHEETGLPDGVVTAACVEVQRRFRYAGRLFQGPETFFLGRVASAAVPGAAGLTEAESGCLLGYRWFAPDELAALTAIEWLEPPELAGVLAELAPACGW